MLSLEAVQDHELVALAASCPPGPGCAGPVGLYHETIGGSWGQVASIRTDASRASVAVHGADVWVLAGSAVYYSTNGGSTFNSESGPRRCDADSLTSDGAHLYLLCVGQGFTGHTIKYVYATTGPGAGWTLVGRPPTPGDGGEISAGSERAIVIASASAAGWLYRSTDGGHRWSTALSVDNGGAPWGDLGFTTTSDAVVIDGPAVTGPSGLPGKLLLSSDGGRAWQSVSF